MRICHLTFLFLPHSSHFQYVLNEGAAELAKICIGHMVWHPENADKRVSPNLLDKKTIPQSKIRCRRKLTQSNERRKKPKTDFE